MEFFGYPRKDGTAGTRNHVGVISTVSCTADPANWITDKVNGCASFTNRQSCGLISPDKEMIYRTLTNLGKNPNLAAVLIVSPGCAAGADPTVIADAIAATGKPVDICHIHQEGGVMAAVARGIDTARKMAADASRIKREPMPVSKLRHGVECGGSTPLSGPVTNAAQGTALDFVIENGGCGGFSETPEVIGAEQIIAARAINDEVKQKMIRTVLDYEERLKSFPEGDFFGSNPDPHNIASGLSSIEEKSIGDIRKGGTTPLTEVVAYGEVPQGKGMFFVDTPGNDLMSLTGLAAAGCNVITYSTECAAPYGFPFVPVIKITARQEHFQKFPDILDYLVDIDRAVTDIRDVGEELFHMMLEISSGRKTQNELIGYNRTCDMWNLLPST